MIITLNDVFTKTFEGNVRKQYTKVFGSRDRLYRCKKNINLLSFEEFNMFVEHSPYTANQIFEAFKKELK